LQSDPMSRDGDWWIRQDWSWLDQVPVQPSSAADGTTVRLIRTNL